MATEQLLRSVCYYYDEDVMLSVLDVLLSEFEESSCEINEATDNAMLFVKTALDQDKWKALRLAIHKHFDCVLWTLYGYSVLSDLCRSRDAPMDIFHELIKTTIVNECNCDDYGMTPLHSAAKNSRDDTMRALLNCGAKTDIIDPFNNLAVDYYCKKSITNLNPELFLLLLPKEPFYLPFIYKHFINFLCKHRAVDYAFVIDL